MKLGPFPANGAWNSGPVQAWFDRLRTIYNVAYSDLLAHVGVGGTAQHPLATTTTAGFAPARGTPSDKFLRDDGTYAYPAQLFKLAGDVSTAAAVTPVDLTGLVWTYEANAVYRFSFLGKVSPTAATTGCGFQLDVSSAVSDISMSFVHQLDNTGTLSGGHSIVDDASVGVSSGMPGTSTYPVQGWGILQTTSNTGTAQLRFRAEVAAVTTCKAGFTLLVERVS